MFFSSELYACSLQLVIVVVTELCTCQALYSSELVFTLYYFTYYSSASADIEDVEISRKGNLESVPILHFFLESQAFIISNICVIKFL